MKKIIMSFCVLYLMLGYNCIGLGGWLSDVTDAAKDTVNKTKTDKSYEQERNKAIAKKITQILADIKNQLLAGNEIDVKSSFAASLSDMRISIRMPFEAKPRDSRLSEEEINKFVAENQQTLGELISEQETLKQKVQKAKKEREVEQEKANKEQEIQLKQEQEAQKEKEIQLKQQAWQTILDNIGSVDCKKEMLIDKYHCSLKDFSQEQINDELKQRLTNVKFTNISKFDSKINLYKDFSSGMSYAWMLLSCNSSETGRIIYENTFHVTFAKNEDDVNQLILLFSNGDGLLPQALFSEKDKEYGIVYDRENIKCHFNDEAFATYITFKGDINIEDVLENAKSKYGKNFKITTTQESIILSPLAYKTLFEYKTAVFENDNIKVEIQQLKHGEEKVEKIAKSSHDYQEWASGMGEVGLVPEALSAEYLFIPSEKEIKEKIEKKNSVKMFVYDMKRLRKLYALYQEELNALNAKRQAKEKEAKDKAAQAKKDALSF